MTNEEIELLSNAHSSGMAEAEYRNPAFRRDLIELLKKHEISAAVAVARLHVFCNEILCHFNTKDIAEYEEPVEIYYLSRCCASKPEVLHKQIGPNLHDNGKRHLPEG